MKKSTKAAIIIGSLAIGIVVTLGSIWLIGIYLDKQYANLHEGCSPRTTSHQIVIKDDVMSPSTFTGVRCDTLTVTNLDDTQRMIAFGVHDQHLAYDGVSEKVLNKGQSFMVTLVQSGDFKVHDHEDDDIKATFRVVDSDIN